MAANHVTQAGGKDEPQIMTFGCEDSAVLNNKLLATCKTFSHEIRNHCFSSFSSCKLVMTYDKGWRWNDMIPSFRPTRTRTPQK